MASRKLPEILDKEETDQLFKQINRRYARGLRAYAMFKLFLNTGLRVSELCSLQTKDINLDKSYLMVRQGKGKKDRLIPFPASIVTFIKDWIDEKDKRGINSKYLFCSYKTGKEGKPLFVRYVQILLKNYFKKTGIEKDIHVHSLRHSYGTAVYQRTKDLESLRRLLGRESISTTQIYINLSDADLKNTILNFAAF